MKRWRECSGDRPSRSRRFELNAGSHSEATECEKKYKNNIFLSLGHLSLPKYGAGAMQFLVGHFRLLGFEGQHWMPIAVASIALYSFVVWKSGGRA